MCILYGFYFCMTLKLSTTTTTSVYAISRQYLCIFDAQSGPTWCPAPPPTTRTTATSAGSPTTTSATTPASSHLCRPAAPPPWGSKVSHMMRHIQIITANANISHAQIITFYQLNTFCLFMHVTSAYTFFSRFFILLFAILCCFSCIVHYIFLLFTFIFISL